MVLRLRVIVVLLPFLTLMRHITVSFIAVAIAVSTCVRVLYIYWWLHEYECAISKQQAATCIKLNHASRVAGRGQWVTTVGTWAVVWARAYLAISETKTSVSQRKTAYESLHVFRAFCLPLFTTECNMQLLNILLMTLQRVWTFVMY